MVLARPLNGKKDVTFLPKKVLKFHLKKMIWEIHEIKQLENLHHTLNNGKNFYLFLQTFFLYDSSSIKHLHYVLGSKIILPSLP